MLERRLRDALTSNPNASILHSDVPDIAPNPSAVAAAVLIAITDRAEPGLILTQRPTTMRSHAGQVAFPGGRVDDADHDHIAAALREAEEEIALPRTAVRVIGALSPYHTGTGYQITPIIGVIPPDLVLSANDDEVSAIFEVPLSFVLDTANHQQREAMWLGVPRHYYEMHWDGFRIWGATAAMIVNLGRQLSW